MKKTIKNFMTLEKMSRVEDFIRSIEDEVIEREVRLAKKYHIFSDNYENSIFCSLFNKTVDFLKENYKNVPSFKNVTSREFFDYIDLTGYIDFVIVGSVKEQLGIEVEEDEEAPVCEHCENLNNIANYLYEDAMGYFFEIRDLQKDWINEADDEDEQCNRICYLLKCACAKAYAETFADGDMEYTLKNLPDTLQGIFVRVFDWAASEEEVA